MSTFVSVGLFLAGIVLCLLSANSLSLYRSRVPREFKRSAGIKGIVLLTSGVLLVGAALTLFIVRSVSSS
jgi:hypothetical protein